MIRVELMKVRTHEYPLLLHDLLTNYSKMIIAVAGANSQQHTEIIFTEDDSSCDSQKWGKNIDFS